MDKIGYLEYALFSCLYYLPMLSFGRTTKEENCKANSMKRYFLPRALIHYRSYGKRCGLDLLPLCSHYLSSYFNSILNKLRYGLNFP